jgi:hypothetical protein
MGCEEEHRSFFAYDANYLINNKTGIIVDAEGTRANRIAEIAITRTMLDRVGRRFHLRPQRLAGDTVCGAVRLLKWLLDRKITPGLRFIPVVVPLGEHSHITPIVTPIVALPWEVAVVAISLQ